MYNPGCVSLVRLVSQKTSVRNLQILHRGYVVFLYLSKLKFVCNTHDFRHISLFLMLYAMRIFTASLGHADTHVYTNTHTSIYGERNMRSDHNISNSLIVVWSVLGYLGPVVPICIDSKGYSKVHSTNHCFVGLLQKKTN